jgi:hypothetical protein
MAGPSSIIGAVQVRAAKLVATGAPDFSNPNGGFMFCGGISKFEHDFEVVEGADIFEEDAGGRACVVRKRFDRVKRSTFTLTMCRSDYRFDEILGVAVTLTSGSNAVGRYFVASTGCGTQTTPNGCSLELWSEQWDCDAALAGAPYMRSIIPRAFLTPKGYTRENGVATPTYNGFGVVNNLWDDGPFGDADIMSGKTSWIYAEIDDVALPPCSSPLAYVNIPGSAS